MRTKNLRNIDPKTLKKGTAARMDSVAATTPALGRRLATNYGYIIEGAKTAAYETRFEYMEVGASTGVVSHPSKYITFRCFRGGVTVLMMQDSSTYERVLLVGDEISIPPQSKYRLACGSSYCELFVTQEANYDQDLELWDQSQHRSVSVDPFLLKDVSEDSRVPKNYTRHKSKAVEQATNLQRSRQGDGPVSLPGIPTSSVPPERSSPSVGINAAPSGGKFDDSGAG